MFRSSKLRKHPKEKKARFFKPASDVNKENAKASNVTSKADYSSTTNPPRAAPQPIAIQSNGFSQSELEEFQESFALFDTEHEGFISTLELKSVLESLRGSRSMPHLNKLLKELSSCSEEDRLDFDDYVALMARTSLHETLQQEESTDETANFSHVFQLFDMEQKGYISIQNLQQVAIELGEYDITQEELEEMIERAQSSEHGRVYLPEFARIMNLNLFHKSEQDATS